jgi:hypothetical protein
VIFDTVCLKKLSYNLNAAKDAIKDNEIFRRIDAEVLIETGLIDIYIDVMV